MAAIAAIAAALPEVIGHSGIPFPSSNSGLSNLAVVFAVISLVIILSCLSLPKSRGQREDEHL